MSDCSFQSFDELSQAFPDLKRKKKLHPIVEKRLALLLQDIYPDAYPQSEPGEIPGGRSDLAFYFGSGRYAIFEVFATVSQVAQDLRHLEQSKAQARIAVLTDPALDRGAIFEEYFRKRPREPFPWVRLSDILVVENEAAAKEQLKQYIDQAFASDKVPSEPVVDIASRLEDHGLSDISDPNFGVTNLTRNLFQYIRSFQEPDKGKVETATSLTIFLAIPTAPLKCDPNDIFKVARQLFDVRNWYSESRRMEEKLVRYYAYGVFPLNDARVRTEQNEVIVEEPSQPRPDKELINFSLRINELGEVSFARSLHTVDQFTEDVRIFRLGPIIHLFWSFLCLVREFQENIGYVGDNHVCLAMVGTGGSYLGYFAEGWRDTYKIVASPSGRRWLDEFCRDSNVRICHDVDLSTLEWKVEPEILYYVAERIAGAYNQPEARCFDRETGKLPGYLYLRM